MHLRCVLFVIFTIICIVSPKSILREKRNSCNTNCDKSCNTCNNQCSTNTCNNCIQSCSGQQSCVEQQCSNTCNSCVINCNKQCQTTTCRNNCVEACPASRNTCESKQNCQNSCSECKNDCAKECPSTGCQQKQSTCGVQNCANNCSNQCGTSQCVNSCMNNCNTNYCPPLPPIPTPVRPEIVVIRSNDTPPVIHLGNTSNVNNVNLTTHINVHNVVNNINNITVPVYINYTNINNVNINNTHQTPYQPIQSIPPFPIQSCTQQYCNPQCTPNSPNNELCENNSTNCCDVYHPRTCYTDRNTATERCVIPRHRECSNICTSPVISIDRMPPPEPIYSRQIPMPPLPPPPPPQPQCHFVRNYPYMYCGDYQRTECGQCYQCQGQYNPEVCSTTQQCPQTCRANMINCIPTSRGMYCL